MKMYLRNATQSAVVSLDLWLQAVSEPHERVKVENSRKLLSGARHPSLRGKLQSCTERKQELLSCAIQVVYVGFVSVATVNGQ